jgi:hypothetical protein
MLLSRFVVLDASACEYFLPHFLTPCSGMHFTVGQEIHWIIFKQDFTYLGFLKGKLDAITGIS